MIGIQRVGTGIQRRVFAGFPPDLKDGDTVKWFDYLQNLTADGSNLISSWDNVSGIPGIIAGALLQAVGTNMPLLTATGVLFDIDNFMKTAPFTLEQPTMIYIVVKQVSWTSGDYILDGNTNSSGSVIQTSTSPGLKTYAGTLSTQNDNLAVGAYGIIRCLFNGASSKFQINETAAITADFGSVDMGGFTLGAQGDGGSKWSNIETPEIVIRKSVVGEVNIFSYLKSKYGTP